MVGERESEKAQLSVFGKKYGITIFLHPFFTRYLHTSRVFITPSKVYLESMLCVLPTSRKTSVCSTASESGGLS